MFHSLLRLGPSAHLRRQNTRRKSATPTEPRILLISTKAVTVNGLLSSCALFLSTYAFKMRNPMLAVCAFLIGGSEGILPQRLK
jgi:hypothetical protein